ncbi:hypothetical protein [Yersinia proxima]|uniref:Uncharacterized protein n=1 Tax=Yersinia proxima TaxID=2890316 RepID=A0ABW9F2H3_9GAMM|nr:hypothetical protein [Yersinia proxima]CNL51867.1 Uncharacterised protein [Yersinia intermedia]
MLQAVLHGKAGTLQIAGKELAVSWRSLFKSKEDLLTASLFTRVSYFPEEWMKIFFTSLFGQELEFGVLKKRHFWPRFPLEQQTVEPDLVFSFESKDILVEVKPPEGGKQNYIQWRKEIDSFLQQRETKTEIDRELIFVALGNNATHYQQWSETLKLNRNNLSIYCLEWKQVQKAIMAVQLVTGSDPLLDDCLAALALYGILQPVPHWQQLQQYVQRVPLSKKIFSDLCPLSLVKEIPLVPPISHWQSLSELISNQPLPIDE